jgi:hypothetical protein
MMTPGLRSTRPERVALAALERAQAATIDEHHTRHVGTFVMPAWLRIVAFGNRYTQQAGPGPTSKSGSRRTARSQTFHLTVNLMNGIGRRGVNEGSRCDTRGSLGLGHSLFCRWRWKHDRVQEKPERNAEAEHGTEKKYGKRSP